MSALLLNLLLAVTPAVSNAPVDPVRAAVVDAAVDRAMHTVDFTEVALSPDGQRVAWVQRTQTADGSDAKKHEVYLLDRSAPSAKPVRITAATDGKPHDEEQIAFSPDGKFLAFFSDAASSEQQQLYVTDGSSAPRKLTSIRGAASAPAWSPDGGLIAFLFIEGLQGAHGALEAAPDWSGVVGEHLPEQRIAVVSALGGEVRQVTPPDHYVYEYAWSPDGQRFAVTAARGAGEANWWVAELATIDAASGALRTVLHPKWQITQPCWSPDGTKLAFIQGLMSDFGVNGGDVYVVPAQGGEAVNLTPRMRASASMLSWIDADRIVAVEHQDGEHAVAVVRPSGGQKTLWRGPKSVMIEGGMPGMRLSRDGKLAAAISETFARAPEIEVGAIDALKPVTQVNAQVAPKLEATSLHWKTDIGTVQGWLVNPSTPDGRPLPLKGAPMVVVVHGGPAAMAGPSAGAQVEVLAQSGYAVLLPNPRGSFGSGEAFTRGNVRDFGYGDLRDVLAGVDEAVKTTHVDGNRVGLYGWSYGGYMAMWTVTQTQRFKGVVAGAGIANWQSYYGQNRIDTWMLPFFGKSVYEDPGIYARSSPITFIKKVKTPTLVLQGEKDGEVPLPQALEFWHALDALHVPTALVIYPGEGHRFRVPEHVRDRARRMVGWFDRTLGKALEVPAK